MEIVGEFLGIDTDEGIYTYLRRHYAKSFPALRGVHRTTVTRQASNLSLDREAAAVKGFARPGAFRPRGGDSNITTAILLMSIWPKLRWRLEL